MRSAVNSTGPCCFCRRSTPCSRRPVRARRPISSRPRKRPRASSTTSRRSWSSADDGSRRRERTAATVHCPCHGQRLNPRVFSPEPPMPFLPRSDLVPNTAAYENEPLVKATGFREYDARWLFGPDINLLGVQALGLGLGTYIHELGQSKIVVGHDFRSYSASIKHALIIGLLEAGCQVHDIGLALSPTAYFAQFDLDAPCVAMVTASHNENGWTGVKMGAQRPLTFGPDEMGRLKVIVLNGAFVRRDGGKLVRKEGVAERFIADVARRASIIRPLKV